MGDPLLGVTTRPWTRRPLRRREVDIPTDLPNTDAIFLVLRRMRGPLVTLIVIFAVAVLGLTLIPGVDAHGNTIYFSAFDAFYFMAYTATTIGFGELPVPFTIAQRMWVTACIFASVTGWAYTIGSLFALFQDPSFRRAVSLQRFRGKVARLREPFVLIVGYGQAGRTLASALDRTGRRLVVLDEDPTRINALVGDQLTWDVPSFAGDPRDPSLLGLAGLAHPTCEAVLAMTDKDEMNLSVLMAAHLLRPDVPVIVRCSERRNLGWMADFEPQAIINPFDRYGAYLTLGLQRPTTHRLASWLLAQPGSPLPEPHDHLTRGRWVVVADSAFGSEVAKDLQSSGLEVTMVDPEDGDPDVTDAVGLVAGAESDTINMSIAAHARLQQPDIYIAVRQKSARMGSLVSAFAPDSVFVATDLVAYETFARLEAPLFWGFIEHVRTESDEWSAELLARLVERVGNRTPSAGKVAITKVEAPAVLRWLAQGGQLTIGQLLRHPDDRELPIQVFPTVLVRDGHTTYAPSQDEVLRPDDQLGFVARSLGAGLLRQNLNYESVVRYLATGEVVPDTWLWRWWHDRVARRRERAVRE